MNSRNAKLIRKKVVHTHGIEKNIEIEGKLQRNPQFKKIVTMLKKELLSTPAKERKEFKRSGL